MLKWNIESPQALSHLSWWLPAPGRGGRWPWLLSWPVAGGVRLSVQGWWWGWREHWAPPGSSRLTAATGCLSRDQSSWRDVLVSGSHWSHWFAAARAGSDEAQLSLSPHYTTPAQRTTEVYTPLSYPPPPPAQQIVWGNMELGTIFELLSSLAGQGLEGTSAKI